MKFHASVALVACLLGACTPQAGLIMAALPDGMVPILLSHLEQVDDSNLRRVAELDRQGNWSGLAAFAEENIAKDRRNADWWTVAGYAYSRLGRYSRAIKCYSEVVRLVPDNLTGWNLLAQAYRAAGQPENAIRILENALLVRRDSPMTFYLLGESYSDVGRFGLAARAYRQGIQLDDKFAQAWFGLGRAYVRLGKRDEAENVVRVLEKLDHPLASELEKSLSRGN